MLDQNLIKKSLKISSKRHAKFNFAFLFVFFIDFHRREGRVDLVLHVKRKERILDHVTRTVSSKSMA